MTKAVDQLDPVEPARATGGGRGPATRARILAAAAGLVAEDGWGQVTTRRIAARAGVNQGVIHYHVDSLDALLREALLSAVEAEMAASMAALTAPVPLRDALRAVAAELDAFDPHSPVGLVFSEALLRAARDPEVAVVIAGLLDRFRAVIAARVAEAEAAGELSADVDPRAAGTALAALYDGLLLHRTADPSTDLAGASDAVLDLLFRPAEAPGGAAPIPGDPTR